MDKIRKELDRRNLLRYLGNSALMLPFMRTLFETQVFGANEAKKALFFFYPNGMVPRLWQPEGSGESFDMNVSTMPLEKVRKDIVIIKNSDYIGGSGTHEGGAAFALTGCKQDDGARHSIDSMIGEHTKNNVQLPVFRLGVQSNNGQDASKAVSYFAPGKQEPIEDNPIKCFNQLYGGTAMVPTPTAPSMGNNTPKPPAGLGAKGTQHVIDHVRGDLKSLQNRLGVIEKVKLDEHIQAVDELERQIKKAVEGTKMDPNMNGSGSGGTASASCKASLDGKGLTFDEKAQQGSGTHHQEVNIQKIMDIQIALAIQALACGITNVCYFQMSRGANEIKMHFPGGPGVEVGHHTISHFNRGTNEEDRHAKTQAWMMEQYAKMIAGLGAVKFGDQSLLYNSMTMCVSDLAHSQDHNHVNMGIVIGGQAGGKIKTGRVLDAKGANHAQTLVSMVQAFGMSKNTIGSGTGPLPGLLT